MAIIKPGPMVSEARGKVGGVVFARNQGGLYVRNFAAPVQPQTPLQGLRRGVATNLSQRWSEVLSSGQRAGWDAYGQEVGTVNSLGESIQISGLSAYVKGNTVLVMAGQDIVDAPPSVMLLGPGVTSPGPIVLSPAAFSVGPIELDGASGTGFVIIQTTAPQNSGRLSHKGIPMFQPGGLVPADDENYGDFTDDVGPTLNLNDVYDVARAVGQVIFIRLRAVTVDGRIGPEHFVRAEVAATPT